MGKQWSRWGRGGAWGDSVAILDRRSQGRVLWGGDVWAALKEVREGATVWVPEGKLCTGGERIGCWDSGVCMGLELPPSSCVRGLSFQECHRAHDDFVSSPAVLLTHGTMPVVDLPFSEEYCQNSGNLSWVQHASFPEHTAQCPGAVPLPDSSALPHLLKFRLATIWASIPGCSGPLHLSEWLRPWPECREATHLPSLAERLE